MVNKLNKQMIFRFICVLTFWTVFFFFAVFVPRRFQFKILFPIFTRLFLFAAKVKPHYKSNIDLNKLGPVIYACNHKTFTDTYVLTYFIKKPFSIVLKKEMTNNPFFKFMSWKMGLIPIDRAETFSQKNALEKIKKNIKQKYSIIMFPEGWYHFDKPVGPLKKGIAKIARETDIPVVPMAIYGALNSYIYEPKLIWKNMYLTAGDPIKYSSYNNDVKFLDELKKRIEELHYSLVKNCSSENLKI